MSIRLKGLERAALIGLVGLALTPVAASAQGWYTGVGVGQSKIDVIECTPEIQTLFFDTACSTDDTDTALKIFGGYQFAANSTSPVSAAIEFGYYDFGEVSISGFDSFFGASRMAVEASGLGLSALGSILVTDWLSLFGKVGFLRWDSDFYNEDEIEDFSESESGTDVMFGVGASLVLTDRIGARVEWERFEIDDEDVDMMSASLIYRF